MTLSVRLEHAFTGFDLDVAFEAPLGVTALFGPSGSGKTTVVNAVAGLLRPTSGRIAADEHVLLDTQKRIDLPPHRRRIGYVFQEGRLFPHLSVRQNLLYGRWFASRHGTSDAPAESFERVVEMLGIGPLLARRPGALSGGEKQRVAIGRALLSRPRLILADEPLAGLDDARKAEILPYFERLRDEVSVPVLYVSHSIAEVSRLATTVVAMREGRVTQVGPAAQVLRDLDARSVRASAEPGAMLSARLIAHHADGLSEVETAGGLILIPRMSAEPGARLQIWIPARNVVLAHDKPAGLSSLNALQATIRRIEPTGSAATIVTLAIAGETLLILVAYRAVKELGLIEGGACWALIEPLGVRSDAVSEE